ncbi:hypothetical protein GCM10027590_00280 [Nocardiopsis nanhaiensis]
MEAWCEPTGQRAARGFPDRESAREEALRLARDHTPGDFWHERSREVHRVSENHFEVRAHGMMSQFHFRTLVAERI